jgi:ornithine cyclodeaminase/alanine dehydrogenase-like protein (mu-crystallin family)
MTETLTQIVNSETTSRFLPFPELVDVLRNAFVKGCMTPMRHHHTIRQSGQAPSTLLLMPAWQEGAEGNGYLGIKIVTVVPGNTTRNIPGLTSTYILYDATSGVQLAILDGNAITARRTVAASALAASYLARENSRRLLVIGAGRVASLIPEAYRVVRNIQRVEVWDINRGNAERLVETLRDNGFEAEVVVDLEQAVGFADIISAATLATAPLIQGRWLKPGTHIDLIGGFTPNMREADDDAIRVSSVYVDTRDALHEAGDLVQPMESGVLHPERVLGALDQLCRREVLGRVSEEEITLYKAVGTGLADLAAATMVFKRLAN